MRKEIAVGNEGVMDFVLFEDKGKDGKDSGGGNGGWKGCCSSICSVVAVAEID